MHTMQLRKKIEIVAFMLVTLFISACEITHADSKELVLLDTSNPKDREFQNKLAKAVSPFGQLVNVYVHKNELDLYRTGQKSTITNYTYLMKPKSGTYLDDLVQIKKHLSD